MLCCAMLFNFSIFTETGLSGNFEIHSNLLRLSNSNISGL
jgi:hypothetical protein